MYFCEVQIDVVKSVKVPIFLIGFGLRSSGAKFSYQGVTVTIVGFCLAKYFWATARISAGLIA